MHTGNSPYQPCPRFRRTLSPAFEAHLRKGEPLQFLLEGPKIHGEKGLHLEAQFREGNSLMLYAGLTRVLDLVYQEERERFVPKADKAYKLLERGVKAEYAARNAELLAGDLRGYLNKVEVAPRYTSREGQCQAWLTRRFGRERAEPQGWATMDSESVLGFKDEPEKNLFWKPILEKGRKALTVLATEPEQYGRRVGSRELGGELDLLLWNPRDREFIVMEVKDGSNTCGIYLGPLQVGCYLEAWRKFAACAQRKVLSGLHELLAQKQRLGLVSKTCQLPDRETDLRFRPILVVREPKSRSCCWTKLEAVRRVLEQTWQSDDGDNSAGELLAGLEVYGQYDHELRNITGQYPHWGGNGHTG